MNKSILIIDDEPKMAGILKTALERDGYSVDSITDPTEMADLMIQNQYNIIVSDMKMPKMTGIEVLEKAKKINPDVEFIMITAYATAQTAVESMKKGAYDYLIKPFPIDELKIRIKRIEESKNLKKENQNLKKQLGEKFNIDNLIAMSKVMQDVLAKVRKVAQSKASVLLQGDSGTGKEVIAKAIHNLSNQASKPLITVNCGAIPEGLLESELFGHVKGSFTGAVQNKIGLFKAAEGGTIFLDEIGELPMSLQVKILRVLQEDEIMAVGSSQTEKIDVRVIAATNIPLDLAVKENRFRQDLFYRLNVVPIFIPPLRERKDDIPPLIEHFLKKYSAGKKTKNISQEVINLFLDYDWPGNIRELENTIEHSIVMGDENSITIDDLPWTLQNYYKTNFLKEESISEGTVNLENMSLEEMEKYYILKALNKTNNNNTKAAKLLGITRRTLGYRLKKYGLGNDDEE